jgi:pimeloyl-ACP methyl ester carboxylesterase
MKGFEPRVLQAHEMGEGPPLVLMPGGLTGWQSWIRHQERLADRYRTVRVQPIHNERGSAGEPGVEGYDIDIEIQSLLDTLDHLEIGVGDFAGWSSGGRALLELAVVHPERIRSLTLIEPAAGWVLASAGTSHPDLEAVEDLLYERFGKEITEEDLATFLSRVGLADNPEAAREHPAWENWLGHRMALSWVPPEAMRRRPLDELASIQAPTLVVRGSPPESWLGAVAGIVADTLPRAELLELNGGHAPHIVSYEQFMARFERHLDRSAVSAQPGAS